MPEKINKQILDWLIYTPSGDINFKNNLKIANLETLKEAVKSQEISKTAREKIERKIRLFYKDEKRKIAKFNKEIDEEEY
ncbi:unnamed protein product [marine sediment metagenome]|uniref:Uncharacterized protein n=1 Tax=marine sediment metagenome TaxID=412755 RepID=X1FC70_9ZZZZ